MSKAQVYDALIVGSGVSGSYIAQELTQAGWNCLMLEAGKNFNRRSFPNNELDGNAQLYWNGGVEINTKVSIAMLRPKVVGGGTIVNQALMNQLYPDTFEEWRGLTGMSSLSIETMKPWYQKAEGNISIQEIPKDLWNRNSHLFTAGMDKLGYKWGVLRRAQKDCYYHDKNDCIECLNGCRLDSKQSTPVTSLKRALSSGLTLIAECEALRVQKDGGLVKVFAQKSGTAQAEEFVGKRLILAAGAIGNSKLLLASSLGNDHGQVGRGFYTHPQNMVLARYDEPVNAHKGPFQNVNSSDERFRELGFKLENVFAPPASFAMLLPGYGRWHQELMQKITNFACIEVAIRDSQEGRIELTRKGKLRITKHLNAVDKERMARGMAIITKIFESTGAKQVIPSRFHIGLHLLGGCAIGSSAKTSVVDPEFHLHGHKNIYVADSSIFPSAPGINPSLTIMAFSLQAATQILSEAS